MTAQSLEGKVGLITGASSGLGRAFALALARAGAKLFLVARREEELREVVGEIAAAGSEAAYHVADVRVVPALYDLVDVLLARFKRLDILINSAGLGYRAPLVDLKRTEILEMLETDLHAAIFLCQAAINALVKSAPSDIVNISSTSGLEGYAEATVYGAAKAGIIGFTRALAAELKPVNVRATAICAGSIDTAFFERFRPSVEPSKRLAVDDAVRALMYVLTSPPNVLHGEIVIRPRVV
jgi:NAD(P)-dependent dehydrogenase (short-subunit alcohol dehydrogenase family)